MEHLDALLRHFADLRDGVHGDGARSRSDKERLFEQAVELLDGPARQALAELNEALLLATGTIDHTGVRRAGDGGIEAKWTLAWPEQQRAGIDPVTLHAWYGAGFHHPHLQGATVGVWPLNVFDAGQAEGELATLRAIAAADLHNLVYQRDWRIIPATTAG